MSTFWSHSLKNIYIYLTYKFGVSSRQIARLLLQSQILPLAAAFLALTGEGLQAWLVLPQDLLLSSNEPTTTNHSRSSRKRLPLSHHPRKQNPNAPIQLARGTRSKGLSHQQFPLSFTNFHFNASLCSSLGTGRQKGCYNLNLNNWLKIPQFCVNTTY